MELIVKCPTCGECQTDGLNVMVVEEEEPFAKELLEIAPELKQFEDGE